MKTVKEIVKLLDYGITEIDGYTITISQDNDPINPRKDYDNAGKMVCWHRRYNLGDEQPTESPDEFEANVLDKIEKDGGVVLPLYLYDHSGITMSTAPFSCQWDSGQVGWIYMDADTIRKEWGGKSKRLTKAAREKARRCLLGEVETYDKYLTGDVYGYNIDFNEDSLDSCWGYIGIESVKESAAEALAYYLNKDKKAA